MTLIYGRPTPPTFRPIPGGGGVVTNNQTEIHNAVLKEWRAINASAFTRYLIFNADRLGIPHPDSAPQLVFTFKDVCLCGEPTPADRSKKSLVLSDVQWGDEACWFDLHPRKLELLRLVLRECKSRNLHPDSADSLLLSVFPNYAPGHLDAPLAKLEDDLETLCQSSGRPQHLALTVLASFLGGPSKGFASLKHKDAFLGSLAQLESGAYGPSLIKLEVLALWGLLYSQLGRSDMDHFDKRHSKDTRLSSGDLPYGPFANALRNSIHQQVVGQRHTNGVSSNPESPTWVEPWPSTVREFFQNRDPASLDVFVHRGQSWNWHDPMHGLALSMPHIPGMALHWGHSPNGPARWGIYAQIRNGKKRRYLKVLNKLYPPTSEADNKHMTLHMADLIWWCLHAKQGETDSSKGAPHSVDKRMRKVNYILQHIPVGTPQPLAIALTVAALYHQHQGDVLIEILERGLLWSSPDQQAARLKALSTLVRKTATLPVQRVVDDARVCAIAYYELCFGRSEHVTNWDEERANRCSYTLHIQHPSSCPRTYDSWWRSDESALQPQDCLRNDVFYQELYAEVRAICKPLVTKRNTKETLERFVLRRHEWMASGSSAGYSFMTKDKSGADQRVKGQKRAWAESIDIADVKAFMQGTAPSEVAHASEKMENGKARAIYGVEPMHYLINTYATKGFEERLHLIPGLEKGLTGNVLARAEARRAAITSDANVECTMLDYADFNRHHTPQAQEIIFQVLADLGESVGACTDWIAANRWVASAKRRMAVIFPDSRHKEKVFQGMFSGTRSTDLINTILNLAYFRIADNHVRRVYQQAPEELYHVHQGDDVWISNKNKVWARLVFYTLNRMGFIFQGSKQMFGPQRGEYLRVLYSHGKGLGYFARAMANYILRPVQQKMPLSPQSWAQTIGDAMALLYRRGLGLTGCEVLYQNGISYWVRARAHPKDHAPVQIPPPLLHAPQFMGGLGCAPPGQIYSGPPLSGIAEMPRLNSTLSTSNRQFPSKMTDDWIAHVSSLAVYDTSRRAFDADAVKRSVHALNYCDVLEQLDTERGWAEYKKGVAAARDTIQSHPALREGKLLGAVDLSPRNSQAVVTSALAAAPLIQTAARQGLGWLDYAERSIWSSSIADHDIPVFTQVSDTLQAVITKSRFKSESLTAQAYNMTREEAIMFILSEASSLAKVSEQVVALVALAHSCGNHEAITALVEGVGKLLPPMLFVSNEGLWESAERGLIETLVGSLTVRPSTSLSAMLRNSPEFASTWLSTMARGPALTGHPVIY
ncbi:MAG: RNA-dependent RNA polymerase [Hangzhou nephotettix cincticeps totivirus 1]|nr:MAG: RNA-dependent RNA polymerase [Hangzhou nephotettix cincticeps totivirus 1]